MTAIVRVTAPGSGRTVALTFDDGPGRSTRMVVQGQVLGNHTWDHRDLTSLSATAVANEMDRTTRETVRLTGVRPCVFRPPYGAYDETPLTLAAARRLAVWTWVVDTEDWKARGSSSDYWVRRIIQRARAGLDWNHPVILMHDSSAGNPATLRALSRIITVYRRHGYRFVRL